MACYDPIRAYQRVADRSVFFGRVKSGDDCRVLSLPCGRCIGCRLDYSRTWATRCVHEASLYGSNCFITLTYRDDRDSLCKRDFQLFMKRLRKAFEPRKVRFFGAGEYGSLTSRPHYHACLFNCDFSDRRRLKGGAGSSTTLYRSGQLESLWTEGISSVGSMSFASAAYVARYCLKKITGDRARDHYSRLDAEGRVFSIEPEFALMSRRPGIGREWAERYRRDLLNSGGCVVVNGHEVSMPDYYRSVFSDAELAALDESAQLFGEALYSVQANDSRERRAVREEVAAARLVSSTSRRL